MWLAGGTAGRMWYGLLLPALIAAAVAPADAQVRVRFPSSPSVAQAPAAPAPSGTPPALLGTPPATGAPAPSTAPAVPSTTVPAAPPATPPPATGFDPYSSSPGSFTPSPVTGAPAAPPSGWGTTTVPGANTTLGTPQTPPALFPNGLGNWNPNTRTVTGQAPMRLMYGPRVRYTWVYPNSGDREFGSNDIDVGLTLSMPNFLWSGRPLFVSPGFGLHLWDGPKPPVMSDLPAKAYDAYVDAGWSTRPDRILGGEIGVRFGVFSDFNALTTYSARLQGLGQFHLQTTPTIRLTGGVLYLNRNKYKLFPTFGVLWKPNNRSRYDIYFPRPKLSHYITTVGNYDVWMYLGAEYGGGYWTIEHPDGAADRIDINDIRVMAGFEWGQQSLMAEGKRSAFIEAGWVTEREVLFVGRPADSTTLSDTFMIRGGIGY